VSFYYQRDWQLPRDERNQGRVITCRPRLEAIRANPQESDEKPKAEGSSPLGQFVSFCTFNHLENRIRNFRVVLDRLAQP
jgi:hypothetical protein